MLSSSHSIARATQRLLDIVQSFRNYSRKSESENDFSIVDVKSILDDVLVICNIDLNFREIHVDVKPPEEETFFEVCSSQIMQVLINLMNNSRDAIRHMDEKWIRLEIKELDNIIEFRVIDSGTGIDKEIVPKIFDSYFTTKPKGEGTGIGLGVCLEIARLHGGSLKYELYEGHTSFVFRVKKMHYIEEPMRNVV